MPKSPMPQRKEHEDVVACEARFATVSRKKNEMEKRPDRDLCHESCCSPSFGVLQCHHVIAVKTHIFIVL